MNNINFVIPTRGGTFVMLTEAGASKIQGDPVRLTQEVLEVSQGVGEMLVLQGTILGSAIKNKLSGETISIASLPANARVMQASFGKKTDFFPGSVVMKLGNSINDEAYMAPGAAPVDLGGATPNVEMPKVWVKETSAVSVIGTFTDDVSGLNDGDDFQFWIEYIQE